MYVGKEVSSDLKHDMAVILVTMVKINFWVIIRFLKGVNSVQNFVFP